MADVSVVIAPEAEDASPERQRSDDLFELVIAPALERFDYDVRRIEGLPNADALATMREAACCVVDLTGRNAAVAYACGRRDETGRPTIHLLPAGEKPWLDLPELRTVMYDLATPRSTHQAIRDIQRLVVETLEAASGAQVITATLERVEQKLDRVLEQTREVAPVRSEPPGGIQEMLRSPQEGFMAAVAAGDLDQAAHQLRRLRDVHGPGPDVVGAAALVASAGRQEGLEILREILRDRPERLPPAALRAALSAYVRFHLVRDQEREALDELGEFITERANDPEVDEAERAFLHNLLHMLYEGVNDISESIAHARRAIELDPSQQSYRYNLSLTYEALGQLDEAERLVDEFLPSEQSQNDADHLSQAVDIYLKRDRIDDLRRAYERLKAIDPERANLEATLDDGLRRTLRDAPALDPS